MGNFWHSIHIPALKALEHSTSRNKPLKRKLLYASVLETLDDLIISNYSISRCGSCVLKLSEIIVWQLKALQNEYSKLFVIKSLNRRIKPRTMLPAIYSKANEYMTEIEDLELSSQLSCARLESLIENTFEVGNISGSARPRKRIKFDKTTIIQGFREVFPTLPRCDGFILPAINHDPAICVFKNKLDGICLKVKECMTNNYGSDIISELGVLETFSFDNGSNELPRHSALESELTRTVGDEEDTALLFYELLVKASNGIIVVYQAECYGRLRISAVDSE